MSCVKYLPEHSNRIKIHFRQPLWSEMVAAQSVVALNVTKNNCTYDYLEHFNLAKFYLREHTNKLPCLRVTRWYFLEDENEIGRYHSGVPF